MRKKRLIETKPNYFHGQLLLEEDFLAEQDYHASARRRHNLRMHDWGIVRGLEVIYQAADTIIVNPGFAIGPEGHEIFLDHGEPLELSGFGPNETVMVSLAYEEQPSGNGTLEHKRTECFAVLSASLPSDGAATMVLATVQLDAHAKVNEQSISYARTKYAQPWLPPGSVKPQALDAALRTGWLRVPFRPIELDVEPEGKDEHIPAFRVGATEARSPNPKTANDKERGAGGTMAIPLPPNARRVTRLRVAGSVNEGEIAIELLRGGWDPQKKEHVRVKLVEGKIAGSPFCEEFTVKDFTLDPEYHTLSIWLRGTKKTAISLIAVELSY
jgi:hypothetical protein